MIAQAACHTAAAIPALAATPWRCAITLVGIVFFVGVAYLIAMTVPSIRQAIPVEWEHPIGLYGIILMLTGTGLGLIVSPEERFMGDVGRILHVHVPSAWVSMLCFLVAFVFALSFLFTAKRTWDSAMEAACEVGTVLGMLLLITGAIFSRPTFGVWWSWDPRLTTSAAMVMSFVAVLMLRGLVNDPDRRATWSAIVTIMAAVNVPVTYMSVKWWRSLHQIQSETMGGSAIDPTMRWIMYFNSAALLFVAVWFIAQRWRLAEVRAEQEMPEPLPEVAL
ncbi:MAG: cytochrome c biogenesis protein CcsA [Myxococcota bacterium]